RQRAGLKALDEDQTVARPVVMGLAFFGQVGHATLHEAPLDEPVRGTGRQDKQAPGTHGARSGFGVTQQYFSFASTLPLGLYDQASHFGHMVARVWNDRDAAVNDPIVLQHSELFHVALDDGAAPRHEGTVG